MNILPMLWLAVFRGARLEGHHRERKQQQKCVSRQRESMSSLERRAEKFMFSFAPPRLIFASGSPLGYRQRYLVFDALQFNF